MFPLTARAQSSPQQDATASQPYRSAFEGYRPFNEAKVGNWRELNDEVSRVGGHAGAMKAATGEAPRASGDGSTSGGHVGHGASGGAPASPSTDPAAVRAGVAPTPPSGGTDPHADHGKQNTR